MRSASRRRNETNYCIDVNQGITLPLSNFGVNQRFFNIYDGPSFQDSNAYLNMNKTILEGSTSNGGYDCETSGWMYGYVTGVPLDPSQPTNEQAYLPDAAIAWKQPTASTIRRNFTRETCTSTMSTSATS